MPAFARLPFLALALFGAFAAEAGPIRRDAPAVPARPEGPSTAWTSAEPEPACSQSRRKLWRAGEGWTVRTVTTCR